VADIEEGDGGEARWMGRLHEVVVGCSSHISDHISFGGLRDGAVAGGVRGGGLLDEGMAEERLKGRGEERL
jgi:hypothetical protein